MPRHYDEFAWHLRRLAQVQADGRLVFVLGAGINRTYGLQMWPELIRDLLIESGRVQRLRDEHGQRDEEVKKEEADAIEYVLKELTPDPLLQGALVRTAYPSSRAWINAISKRITNKESRIKAAKKKRPLRIIAGMLVDAIKKDPRRHISVLTFNYDDLLECAVEAELKDQNVDPSVLCPVSDGRTFERSWNTAGIYIYHLHGFLRAEQPEAILDAYSYVPVLQGNHWSWRCMERVLSQTDATALLIGLSLTDPSLRFVLTRWETWKTPVLGVYLAAPPPVPEGRTLARQRQLTFMARSILDLYDAVMDRLQLVAYHLSSWDELVPILQTIQKLSAVPVGT